MSNLHENNEKKPSVLNNASDGKAKTKSDDGFKTFNEIPVNPTMKPPVQKLSPQELLKEKFVYLRKLEALEKKVFKLVKNILWNHH